MISKIKKDDKEDHKEVRIRVRVSSIVSVKVKPELNPKLNLSPNLNSNPNPNPRIIRMVLFLRIPILLCLHVILILRCTWRMYGSFQQEKTL
jgi:hypothetical protein